MLKLSNVNKTYKSKAKTETHALKGVSLEIGSRGMVFVLGKSGSGKSTMLNLLGGLDSPTSGEIFVNGASMAKFTPNDYDSYRNNYVGFIFQEFNLLDDFNVRDNIALTLRLTKARDADKKVSEVLKQVELNDTYLSRRIDEMSGGEKQRIAIARALIKDSRIILADEPTGNLDSATGESIWNILKELSRERLVIVVSHDRESAERYGDRIIEIADGKIITDNGAQPKEEADEAQTKPATARSRLSFATRLKMGFNNLRLRKGKTVSTILVAIFCILSILITQMCVCFTPESAAAQYIKDYKLDYFAVAQGYCDADNDDEFTNKVSRITNGTQRFIDKNCRYITDGIIESKQDILDLGFTFVGKALELDDDSFYTTTAQIEEIYNSGSGTIEVGGLRIDIVKELHSIDFLVGKKISSFGGAVLAGVIDVENVVNQWAVPRIFCNKNFSYGGARYSTSVNAVSDANKDVVLNLGDAKYNLRLNVKDFSDYLMDYNEVILTTDGIKRRTDNIPLADNEIILSYELFARIFGAEEKTDYFSDNYKEILITPSELGKTFDLKFYEYASGELIADCGEVKLVGISFKKTLTEYDRRGDIYTMLVDSNLSKTLYYDLNPQTVLIQTNSVKNLNGFLRTLRRQHLGFVQNIGATESEIYEYIDLAAMLYIFGDVLSFVFALFLAVGAALTIVLILLVINLISYSISSRKKEIGILSAIGTSNKDITSIFLLETVIISAICFVVVLALSFAAAHAFNTMWSNSDYLNILFPFIHVDVLSAAIMIIATFGLPLLAALIPVRKIIRLKPIDAIREI